MPDRDGRVVVGADLVDRPTTARRPARGADRAPARAAGRGRRPRRPPRRAAAPPRIASTERCATGTTPSRRDGSTAGRSRRRSAPNTGTPMSSSASRSSCSCRVGRDPVEDHAAEPQQLVVRPEAVHQRRDRLAHRGHVDDHHDRRAQGRGDARRGVGLDPPGEAVEQAHRALDDRDLGAGAAVREQRGDAGQADQPGVEVAPRATGGEAQVGGVGVVRTDLEAGGREPTGGERGEQADRQRGLAVPGRGRADHHARHGGHRRLQVAERGRPTIPGTGDNRVYVGRLGRPRIASYRVPVPADPALARHPRGRPWSAAAVMVLLGNWQLRPVRGATRGQRPDRRGRHGAAPRRWPPCCPRRAASPAPPVPPPSPDASWTRVTVTGRYDPSNIVLVRGRTVDSQVGFEIVTPLVLADGTAVLVDRGWVPPAPGGGDGPADRAADAGGRGHGRPASAASSRRAAAARDPRATGGWRPAGSPCRGSPPSCPTRSTARSCSSTSRPRRGPGLRAGAAGPRRTTGSTAGTPCSGGCSPA